MFKKSPIALAILALGASLSVAQAQNYYELPTNEDHETKNHVTGSLDLLENTQNINYNDIRPSASAADTKVIITGGDTAVGVKHHPNGQNYFNGFTALEIQSKSANALEFSSGNLAIGLKKLPNPPTTSGRPQDLTDFDPLDEVRIFSREASAVVGRVVDSQLHSDTGEFYLVSKKIRIETASDGHAAIDLEGVRRTGTNEIDYDSSQINILKYTETSWIREDDHGWDGTGTTDENGQYHPNIDYELAKNYGLFASNDSNMQELRIISPKDAVRLVNGSSLSVDAGKVVIKGNIFLKDGANMGMGETTNGLSNMPDAWAEWREDEGIYVRHEAPGDGYYELINNVRIEAQVAPTEDSPNKAAIHVEGGSTFFTAANKVVISGAALEPLPDNDSNKGGNRKPIIELLKEVKGHFKGEFHELDFWQEQLKLQGHQGLVQYADAIYLKTDKSSQYQLSYDQDTMVKTVMPSMVSIWGENWLEINGDIVLDFDDHYSGSLLYIGAAEDAKVLINSDIHVYNDEDGDHENTIKLDLHEGQLFIGSIIDHTQEAAVDPDEASAQPVMFRMMRTQPVPVEENQTSNDGGSDEASTTTRGTHLTLKNNRSTFLINQSVISQLTSENSSLFNNADNASIAERGESSVTIKQLNLVGDTEFHTKDVTPAQFKIENLKVGASETNTKQRSISSTPKLSFHITDMDDKSNEEVAALVSIDNIESTNSDQKSFKYTLTQDEGQSGGTREVFAEIQDDGSIEVSGHQDDNTTVSKAINDVAGLGVLAWRAQMNDVNKRLGDLRTYKGNYGGWARVYGSETKYGDLGLKSESTTVQVGADMKLGNNFYFGVTASYTDGKGKLNNGSTDDRAYSFGVYGGWMGDDGQFVDVIIKEHNFATDFDLRYTTGERSTGDFDLWGTSICAEYGWRLNVTDKLWVEPQAEITYGYMNDVTYTYSGDVKATQEATESLVGRLGVAFGTTFDRGYAYVKASVAHDWMGETEISMSNGNAPMKEDLGGTWGEFSVGGTYNFDNGWAVYGEFQTAKGSKMKTPYQYNIGARYVF